MKGQWTQSELLSIRLDAERCRAFVFVSLLKCQFLAIAGENWPQIQNVLNHRSLTPTGIYARSRVAEAGGLAHVLAREAGCPGPGRQERKRRGEGFGTCIRWMSSRAIDQTNDLAHILTINRAGL